jgi:hypothetical protein
MDMDADTINTIKLNKEGEITNISYDQTADGGTEMVFDFQPVTTATGRKERLPERIKLPKDQKNTAEMNAFYTKLWNILPADIKKGVDFSDIPKVIKPRQGKYTGRKVAYRNIQKIETQLDNAIANPKRGIFKALGDSINTWVHKINPKAPQIKGNKEGFLIGPEGEQKKYKLVNPGKGTVLTPDSLKQEIMNMVTPPEAKSSATESEVDISFSDEDVKNAQKATKGMSRDSIINIYHKQAIEAGSNISKEKVQKILEGYKII